MTKWARVSNVPRFAGLGRHPNRMIPLWFAYHLAGPLENRIQHIQR